MLQTLGEYDAPLHSELGSFTFCIFANASLQFCSLVFILLHLGPKGKSVKEELSGPIGTPNILSHAHNISSSQHIKCHVRMIINAHFLWKKIDAQCTRTYL